MSQTQIEERLAHLMRALEDMSDVVREQDVQIARLNRLVQLLIEREAEREATALSAPVNEQKPPHW